MTKDQAGELADMEKLLKKRRTNPEEGRKHRMARAVEGNKEFRCMRCGTRNLYQSDSKRIGKEAKMLLDIDGGAHLWEDCTCIGLFHVSRERTLICVSDVQDVL